MGRVSPDWAVRAREVAVNERWVPQAERTGEPVGRRRPGTVQAGDRSAPAEPFIRIQLQRVFVATVLGFPAVVLLSEVLNHLVLPDVDFWTSHAVTGGLLLAAAATASLIMFRLRNVLVDLARHDRDTEGKYRALVSNIPDVAWTVDPERNFRFISPVVETILGYTQDEMYRLGGRRIWSEFLHPDDAPMVAAALEGLFLRRQPYVVECRVRRKDGRWVWIHSRAVATYEKDGVALADGLMSDITTRKQAEEAVRAQEAEYRRLVSNLPDVTWSSAVDGRTVYISPNVQRVLGYTAAEFCE